MTEVEGNIEANGYVCFVDWKGSDLVTLFDYYKVLLFKSSVLLIHWLSI